MTELGALQADLSRLNAALDSEGVSSGLHEDEMPPSERAREAYKRHLRSAASSFLAPESFPFPHVETWGDGDLRCEWNWGTRAMSLTFSPQGLARIHIFDSTPGKPLRTTHAALSDTKQLVNALRWVAGYAPTEG